MKVKAYNGVWYEVRNRWGLIVETQDYQAALREYYYQARTLANNCGIDDEDYTTLEIEKNTYRNGRLIESTIDMATYNTDFDFNN